ncbi:predicted protein [Histoplasma capsulatum H143]|uniref:Uncharacterized protein n=1 Tax=Ajellomyces capsulatus (strain H143) TaxID=544712 RepID=C6HF94_AJECH|nr:predicted protein [Histoplasma capsulatum H143]
MAYNVKSECHTWKARISHSRHFRTANAIIDISPGGGGPGKGEFRIHTSHALHPSVQPHSTAGAAARRRSLPRYILVSGRIPRNLATQHVESTQSRVSPT